MNDCDQELCPYWSGDGNVCPCAVFDIERDPYDKPVFVQGHTHSEPICAWPNCTTYLTRQEMHELQENA